MFHHHSLVHRLAHVINGQKADLDCGECFHFYTGLAMGFDGGGAAHGVLLAGNTSNSTATRVRAKGWHSGIRLLVCLAAMSAGNACHAQHIAFFGCAFLDDLQRGWVHHDAASSATAKRWVGALPPTSTIWAWPWASKWVRPSFGRWFSLIRGSSDIFRAKRGCHSWADAVTIYM